MTIESDYQTLQGVLSAFLQKHQGLDKEELAKRLLGYLEMHAPKPIKTASDALARMDEVDRYFKERHRVTERIAEVGRACIAYMQGDRNEATLKTISKMHIHTGAEQMSVIDILENNNSDPEWHWNLLLDECPVLKEWWEVASR